MLIKDNIPNFIGGVSQQPDKLMFQSCAKELINFLPSATQGLTKRPPTNYVNKLQNYNKQTFPKIHMINNENTQCCIVCDGEDIKAFDTEGNQKIIDTLPSIASDYKEELKNASYMVSTNTLPRRNFYTKIPHNQYARVIHSSLYTDIECTQPAFNTDTLTLYYAGIYIQPKDYQIKIRFKNWLYTDSVIAQPNIIIECKEVLSYDSENEPILSEDVITLDIQEACTYRKDTQDIISFNEDSLTGYINYGTINEEHISLGEVIKYKTPEFYYNSLKEICETKLNNKTPPQPEDIVTVGKDTLLPNRALVTENKNYIQTNTPLTTLALTTVGNYTYILNKSVVTKMLDEKPANPYQNACLVFIKQADYNVTYTLNIEGKTVSFTTSSSDANKVKTTTVKDGLVADFKSKFGAKWADSYIITEHGSCFMIQRKDKATMTVTASDSNGNRNMYAFYHTADALENLPLIAPNGFILKITGEGISANDDYYVQFVTNDDTDFSNGTWQECCSPDVLYKIDNTTMPYILEYTGKGFIYHKGDYTDRRCGDEESAKTPSFIGKTIQEIFTHKGRIGFLSSDKSIYSDTEDVFAFFKKTTQTKLDTDPIDLGSNSRLATLIHSLQYNTNLLLFSPTSIFQIKGGDVFSNSTVTMDMLMEYPCSPVCSPIALADNAFFVTNHDNSSNVYEIYLDVYATISARSITEALPTYIPKNIYKITGSVQNNLICFLSSEEPNNMYVYSYYFNQQQQQKIQNAWCKWNFGNTKILYAEFIDDILYLFTYFNGAIHLETINCNLKQTDGELDFLIHIDKKKKLTRTSYQEANHTSVFTIPNDYIQDFVIIDSNGFRRLYTIENNYIYINGDYQTVYIGELYNSLWVLPTIYKKQLTQAGQQKTVEGLLMLKDIDITYSRTGYFKVSVIPHYDSLNTYHHVFENLNNMLGTPTTTLGHIPVTDGTILIPIMAKNEDITIQIENNSYLPSTFNSLNWLGNLCIRGNQKN